jgi:hypothetical protein
MNIEEYIGGLTLHGEGALIRSSRGRFRAGADAEAPADAAVDVGAVIAFDAQVSRQERADVLDSVQLAQRAATGAYDRFESVEPWYGKFIEVLERVGWVPETIAFMEHEQKSGELEMDAEALSILEMVATGGALSVLKQAIVSLKGSAGTDRKIELFTRHATSDSSGNFQVGAVQKEQGFLTMAMGAYHYRAADQRTGFVFGKWGSNEVRFWSSAQKMAFQADQYDKVRDLVRTKLGDPTAYVASLGQLA